ncbi:PfkB family carbohydrate kinase [Streptomyces sp. NPDC059874]|uniref:PfkB family carbohydrate kinase n=1 Tax=Streptomyces sp. NPDC059874 TaxID=3346983 RepID=UPI00364886B9
MALVDTDEPRTAAARYRAPRPPTTARPRGRGHRGSRPAAAGRRHGRRRPPPRAGHPAPVDATGAGECFTGTATARLALGDTLADAVAYGPAAASLSVSGRGDTGHVPAFRETAALAARAVLRRRSGERLPPA